MSHPLFSIIIPTYNRSKIMVKSISSVFSQDFSDFELIIVDDGGVRMKPNLREWSQAEK